MQKKGLYNVKKSISIAICTFILVIFAVSQSSATTISHRYIIPGTDCSIEFPWFFKVCSSEMDVYEPVLYEWDFDLDESLEIIRSGPYSIMAVDTDIDMMVSILVQQYDGESGIYTCSLSEESLKSLSTEMAEQYFDSHEGCTPYKIKDPRSSMIFDYIKCLNWAYSSSYDGNISLTEHYYLVENTYAIDFIFDFPSENQENIVASISLANDIMNSVRFNYMEK